MSSEDDLLRRLKRNSRDAKAWTELYDLLQPQLNLFVYSLSKSNPFLSVDDADDVVHNVLVRLVEDFKKRTANIETFDHLRNYLYKSCRNEAISRARQGSVEDNAHAFLQLKFSDVMPTDFTSQLSSVETRKMIEQMVSTLDARCGLLVKYYLLEEGTLAKYAKTQGLSAGTVYSQWSRCLTSLKKILRPDARN